MLKEKQVFLGVYVDDHMAGQEACMETAWSSLKKHFEFGEIINFSGTTYLGCTQSDVDIPEEEVKEKTEVLSSSLANNTCTTAQDFGMRALKVTSAKKKKRRPAKTSNNYKHWYVELMDENKKDFALALIETSPEVRGWFYQMEGAAQGCVDRYLELAKVPISSLRKVGAPCLDDHLLPPEEFVEKCMLSPVCSQDVLKCLYMTRLARPELYWAVNSIAREVTKWTVACDTRLHRLISFIYHHKDSVIKSWLGNKASACKLMLFCYASFAIDLKDSKSTSGSLLCLVGSHTFCPITWMCKKQGCVSHSSTESEIDALDMGLRLDDLPAMTLWDMIIHVLEPLPEAIVNKSDESTTRADKLNVLPADTHELMMVDFVPSNVPKLSDRCKMIIMKNNDAKIKMCVKIKPPTTRHMARTHRIDVDALFERIHGERRMCIKYINKKLQIADICTKGSFSVQTWNTLSRLLQVGPIVKNST